MKICVTSDHDVNIRSCNSNVATCVNDRWRQWYVILKLHKD